jgi:hypothetical protein
MATTGVLSADEHLVLLRRFRDLPDAFLFQSILDSAEIECFLADENTIRMDWFWSNALGGIKLCVRATDAETASSLLAQPVLERFDVEGIGEYEQPRCANCQSLEVSFQGLNKAVDYVRALLGGPRPLHRSLWQCDSCGHQWPESGQKPPANLLIAASSCLLLFLAAQTFLGWLLWAILSLAASR